MKHISSFISHLSRRNEMKPLKDDNRPSLPSGWKGKSQMCFIDGHVEAHTYDTFPSLSDGLR